MEPQYRVYDRRRSLAIVTAHGLQWGIGRSPCRPANLVYLPGLTFAVVCITFRQFPSWCRPGTAIGKADGQVGLIALSQLDFETTGQEVTLARVMRCEYLGGRSTGWD